VSDRFIWLQDGLVIPMAAVEALLAVENAGHRITIDGDDVLIEPRGTVDADDLQQLRKWKQHVLLLLRYTPSDHHLRDSTITAPAVGPIVRRIS